MLRARRIACLALATLFVSTQLAVAQSRPPSATPRRSARVRDALSGEALASFDRASILFGSRNFGPARAEFVRAHELSGEPRVLYNVAVCDKELGRYARAIASLRQSLTEGASSLPNGYIGTVNDTIALLAPLVTQLAVTTDTDGAAVLLDDEAVGMTPLTTPLPIDVGEHAVLVRKAGYVDAFRHVSAVGGRPLELSISLEPVVKKGHLSVKAGVGRATPLASVFVDNGDVGNAPWEGDVPAGLHAIELRAAGFSSPLRQVSVAPGQTTELTLQLVPDARLRLTVDDESAKVRLDGALLGHGDFDGPVPSGEHHLEVSAGGTPYQTEFALQRGETRSMSIQIRRGGEVPSWVWIGGGALVVAGAVTAGVLYLTASKKFEGSTPGTLNPALVPTGLRFGSW